MASQSYVEVKGCRLWVQVARPTTTAAAADAQWVLLMHGFPDTADMWRAQVQALTAAGLAVAAPDMPGFGRSAFLTNASDVQQYSLRSIVSVMVALLDRLGIAKAAVVGHDWGAAVAWALAQRAPGRVTQLVVLSVGHPGAGAAVDPRQRAHWWYQLFFCLPGSEAAVSANGWALFRQIMGRSVGQQQLEAYVQQLSQPGALTAALNWYRANTHACHFGATQPLPAQQRIAVPVMGVWSTEDSALLEAQMTASSSYVAPGCWQYERIEGGHWIARDAPQQLNKLLVGFLTQGGGGVARQQRGQQSSAASSRTQSKL